MQADRIGEGCTAPAYHSQVHHAVTDWAAGGHTDITEETLVCGPHNRRATPGAWKTRKLTDGRTEWLPPPNLDWGHLPVAGDGQARTNKFHHPECYLIPDDNNDNSDDADGDGH